MLSLQSLSIPAFELGELVYHAEETGVELSTELCPGHGGGCTRMRSMFQLAIVRHGIDLDGSLDTDDSAWHCKIQCSLWTSCFILFCKRTLYGP